MQGDITKRMFIICVAVFLLATTLVGKLMYIQFIEGKKYREVAKNTMVKNFVIEPNRGNIYSDDGSLLATSVIRYNIFFDSKTASHSKFKKYIEPLSDSLGSMFNRKSSYYIKLLTKARKHGNRYLPLARRLSYLEYKRLRNFPLLNLSGYKGGIIVEQKKTRERPLGARALRTIGYEFEDDKGYSTRVGLEGAFSKYLRGEEGHRMKQRIFKGQWKPISNENEVEPKNGIDVIATINANIQDVTHYALLKQMEYYKAKHGCAVVMDVQTGEVKAISNLGVGNDGKYRERLNYAVGEAHEPGSTFKLAALVSALDDKVVDTNTRIATGNGVEKFYDKYVRDTHKGGFGTISVSEMFEVSSNVGFSKMIYEGYKNHPEKFVNHLYKMGLNDPLGIPIIGEGRPYIPHPSNKKTWYGTTLPWMAFGYGVSLTPLQTLTLYNAIANDGMLVRPTFLKALKNRNKKKKKAKPMQVRICSKETAKKARNIMSNVVRKKHGTGYKLRNNIVSIAGKTGTCQKNYSVLNKNEMQYISSFAGYFPAENPKYSCIVVIHEPNKNIGYYGADVSGPVFKEIAQKTYASEVQDMFVVDELNHLPNLVQKDFQKYDEILKKYITVMPNVEGMPLMDAVSVLENMGVRVEIKGKKGLVQSQSLNAGQKINKNKIIVLHTS